jgi:hypothetical protein
MGAQVFLPVGLGTLAATAGEYKENAMVAASTNNSKRSFAMNRIRMWACFLMAALLTGAAWGQIQQLAPPPPAVRLITAQAREVVRRPVGQVQEVVVTAALDKDWPANSVSVIYTSSNGVTKRVNMRRDFDYDHHQVYSACIPESPIRFKVEALRMISEGYSYRLLKTTDDNNGQWYGVQANSNSNGYVAGVVGGKVALRSARNVPVDPQPQLPNRSGTPFYGLQGEVFVEGPVLKKSVAVIFTADKGKTWTSLPATFKGTAFQNPNVQIWEFSHVFPSTGGRNVEFYVVHQNGQQVYPDTNFDYNYLLKAGETITVERW